MERGIKQKWKLEKSRQKIKKKKIKLDASNSNLLKRTS